LEETIVVRKTLLTLGTAAAIATAPAAFAAETVKIGFVTTLTTPAAVIGNDMRDAADLAMEHIGHMMGGKRAELVYADDEINPQAGKQKTEKLLEKDGVDIVTGYIWSNVLLAASKTVLDSGKILISANAGPSQLAGKQCHKNYFNISWQNDQTPMALGETLNQQGIKSVYVMAPNYAAGKNMVEGVERTFKGKVVGKDMTKWPDQIDWSAELSKAKAANPDAVWIFYPGKHGPAFIKQYEQAGLAGKIPLYSVFTIDALSLPRFQEAKMEGVLGHRATMFWSPDLDTPQNKKFVSAFRAKYGRYPSHYGAQSYDAIFFIKSAVDAVNGDMSNVDGMREALRRADFPSVRGAFRMGPNHYPIQDFYLREAVVGDDGVWTTKIVGKVYSMHQDSYAAECKM
jgi:branched-chain amino acid transport system substrate-binding protein